MAQEQIFPFMNENKKEDTPSKKLSKKPIISEESISNNSKLEDKRHIKDYLHNIQKPSKDGKYQGGIPLLYDDSTIYVDSQDSHSLIIGATGAKKTRLLILPLVRILGFAGESMIICDPKAEVYNRTAKWLSNNDYNIEVINFRNPNLGDNWNPLQIPFDLYINGQMDRACEFINDIAGNLFLQDVSNRKDPYWDYTAADTFFGLTMLAFSICKDKKGVSIKDVLDLRHKVFLGHGEVDNLYRDLAKQESIIYYSLQETFLAPTNTQACILSVFDQNMRFFIYQSSLISMMSKSTISFDDLGDSKVAVFLIMPDEKSTYHKLVSLFVKQSYEVLIFNAQQKNHDKGYSNRINYILDEFSSLPTIRDFPNMITAARSRNIRFNLVIQSLNQLKSRYDKESETIIANCNNWIYLTSREIELLELLSKLCGINSNGRPIFSISFLQHLDKNKGQALILCGRLYPFISELKDIKEFDDEEYEIMPLRNNSD